MNFLLSSISDLGFNKYLSDKIKSLVGGNRIIDLLFHFPRTFLIRISVNKLDAGIIDKYVKIKVKVTDYMVGISKKTPIHVLTKTDNGQSILITYFNMRFPYIKSLYKIGDEKIISGKVSVFNGDYQILHPEYVESIQTAFKIPEKEPVYSLTAGITNACFVKIIKSILKKIPDINDWIPKHYNFPSLKESLIKIHTDSDNKEYKDRVSIDELIAIKYTLNKLRNSYFEGKVCALDKFFDFMNSFYNEKDIDLSDVNRISKILGVDFDLTDDQINAIMDITSDLLLEKKMSRLLQGDVGSGKTIVALITSVLVVASGYQVAILAPTEILAEQHYNTFVKILNNGIKSTENPFKIVLITGKTKRKNTLYKCIKNNEFNIIIGTHALIEDSVEFFNLGYVIIDEQHKFGVIQRNKLKNKEPKANVLYMSATPIPRTLMKILNNDMEISYIKQKPAVRKQITTVTIPDNKINDLVEKLKYQISNVNKVFWVCALVEDSEKLDLTSAEERYSYLKNFFGEDKVLLIHGKMNEKEKNEVMLKFKNTDTNILVSTTVIEVGVDVPEANIIVIENAERFGLAQLHQLRGRVGRGASEAFCVLVYKKCISETAAKRLSIIKNSTDGFFIAEKDMEIRGFGDCIGLDQTGITGFKVADPFDKGAFEKAAQIVPEEQNMELLLQIFNKQID